MRCTTRTGTLPAMKLFQRYRGTREIAVTSYNRSAIIFWRSVIASIRNCRVDELTGDRNRWSGPIWRLTLIKTEMAKFSPTLTQKP